MTEVVALETSSGSIPSFVRSCKGRLALDVDPNLSEQFLRFFPPREVKHHGSVYLFRVWFAEPLDLKYTHAVLVADHCIHSFRDLVRAHILEHCFLVNAVHSNGIPLFGLRATTSQVALHPFGVMSDCVCRLSIFEEHFDLILVSRVPADAPASDILGCFVILKFIVDPSAPSTRLLFRNGRLFVRVRNLDGHVWSRGSLRLRRRA